MQTTAPPQDARIAIEPGFAWDEQNAYLFDIDGTLLHSRDPVHFESFAAGKYTFDELLKYQPQVCVTSLAHLMTLGRKPA